MVYCLAERPNKPKKHMYIVSCKNVEPSLGNDHFIKGMNMADLKRNIRFHLRETHPESYISDKEMYAIYGRVEEEAQQGDIIA